MADKIKRGLAPQEVAASVSFVELCDPLVAEWMADPWSKVLPESEWPDEPQAAPVHCSSVEWGKVCNMLVDRRMLRPIGIEDVFHARGKPVFIGAFAVEKQGKVPAGLKILTRLITNCVTDAYLRSLVVGLKTLLGAGGWCNIVLWQGSYIIRCSDDMTGAYFSGGP